jgi:RNA polymerase sigma factor (sigma-70 family)
MQWNRLPPGAKRAARRNRTPAYTDEELRSLLARVRDKGDLQARDLLLAHFDPWLARLDVYYRGVASVVDDVYGQGSVILMQLFEELVPEPDADPRAVILDALRREIKKYLRQQLNVASWEIPWISLSPETPAEELAAAIDGKQRARPSLGDILNRADPRCLEEEVVCDVTLQQALAPLPEFHRTVVILHALKDYKYEEVAAATQTQAANCRQTFKRALGRMALALQDAP